MTFPTSANIQVGPACVASAQALRRVSRLRASSAWQQSQNAPQPQLHVCSGCHNPTIRSGLFVGCGFSELQTTSCVRSVTKEKHVRVTGWRLEFTDQDCGAVLLPQLVLPSKK